MYLSRSTAAARRSDVWMFVFWQMENAGYELERLYTEVTSLCSRIELLPCSTARDRLAQSGKTTMA